MTIFVIGLNHKTASVALRERIYFAPDKISIYLQDMLGQGLCREAVLLSTCNRSELYCESEHINALYEWFCAQASLTQEEVKKIVYCYVGEQAVSHMMRVACGLDSMVLGEPQIFGQMKEAFSESYANGAVGASFHRLFQHVFSVAKEIRATTAIGACPVSVVSATIHFLKQQVPLFADANVMLLGAGDTTARLIQYLQPVVAKPLLLVNRSLEKAKALMQNGKGMVYHLDQLYHALEQADVVITATGSATPLITRQLVDAVKSRREQFQLNMVDIAVPRDIDPEVAHIPGVSLYCIDDLKMIIEHNRQGREHASIKALEMITERSSLFVKEAQHHEQVTQVICSYRNQVESICRAELLKAKQQLLQGTDPQEVLENFAWAFTQKMLHSPSVQMRQAGAEGRFELLALAKELFAIS